MAKPRFVFVDKKTGNLIWELPSIGRVRIEDSRRKYKGRVTAILERGGRKKVIGEIPYNLLKGKKSIVAVQRIEVNPTFQRLGVARAMFGHLESKSQGKVVWTREAFDSAAGVISSLGGYTWQKGRMGDFSDYYKEVKDAKKWKKMAALETRKKKMIRRR